MKSVIQPPDGRGSRKRRKPGPHGAWRAESVPLFQLLSPASPRGAMNIAIRKAQMDSLIRMVPAILAGQLITGSIVVLALAGSVPVPWLVTWLAALATLCTLRGIRGLRLRNADYRRRHPPDARVIMILNLMLATLWWIPPLFFFDLADSADKVLLMVTAAGLVSAATSSTHPST